MMDVGRIGKPRGGSRKLLKYKNGEKMVPESVEPVAICYPDEGFHWISAEFTGKE